MSFLDDTPYFQNVRKVWQAETWGYFSDTACWDVPLGSYNNEKSINMLSSISASLLSRKSHFFYQAEVCSVFVGIRLVS